MGRLLCVFLFLSVVCYVLYLPGRSVGVLLLAPASIALLFQRGVFLNPSFAGYWGLLGWALCLSMGVQCLLAGDEWYGGGRGCKIDGMKG